MSVIRFDYTPEVFINPKTQKVDYVYRPLIDVRLCYKHNFGKNLVGREDFFKYFKQIIFNEKGKFVNLEY